MASGSEYRSRSLPPLDTYRCPFAYAGMSDPSIATVRPISGRASRSAASTRSMHPASASPCSRSLTVNR